MVWLQFPNGEMSRDELHAFIQRNTPSVVPYGKAVNLKHKELGMYATTRFVGP